jgi:hypothetical protein
MIDMTPGPMMMTKIAGKMKKTSGKSIFTGSFAAISRMRWLRATRIVSACTCSTFAMLTPSWSAW